MEAEAAGRAVLTTEVTGCRDTVVVGENGFLIPCGDEKTLAEKMIWLLEHSEEVALMCENSRKLAEKKFDQKAINEKICEEITA